MSDLSAFRNAAAAMRSREGFGGAIINFNHERGEWTTGSGEKKTIIDGRTLVAGFSLILFGWQKFADKRPVYADVGFVRDRHEPCARDALDDREKFTWRNGVDPWKQTYFLPALDAEAHQHFMIVTNSVTGKDALAMLQIAFVEHNETRPDRPPQWPIVALANDGSFESQHGKKIWKPLYEIVSWTDPPPNFQAVTPPPAAAAIEHAKGNGAATATELPLATANQKPAGNEMDDEIPF